MSQDPLAPKWWSGIPHEPTDLQWTALVQDWYREILYGGAAGGGKSDWLLMTALQYVDVPGYSCLILRRTFPQLKMSEGLLPRAQEWLTGKAHGVETLGGMPTKWMWDNGAILEFGHLQSEKDKYNYQGGAWQTIIFDELTQFTESMYLYMFSRNRRPRDAKRDLSSVPLRIRSASNPGGEGHSWVKQRFVVSNDPERLFIPARLTDNPYLDAEEYQKSLENLHPYERDQLLRGDWDARPPGSSFKREWFTRIEKVPDNASRRTRYWDLAATEKDPRGKADFSAGVLGCRRGKDFFIEDVVRFRAGPGETAETVKRVAENDGHDVAVRIEQEPGASGKFAIHAMANMMPGYDVRGRKFSGDKFVRASPLASAAHRGNVYMVEGQWNEDFIVELEHFAPKCSHDDQVDAVSGLYKEIVAGHGLSPQELYGEGGLLVHPA